MKIKVIGKSHMEGKSKRTGNEYNFNQAHYIGVARSVVGQAALTVNLDPALVSYDSIQVGADYNVEFDNRGYCVTFDLLSK